MVLLADPPSLDLARQGQPSLGVDEGDIIHDERIRFWDPLQIFCCPFGRELTVTAAVKGPGTAERAIPGTPTRELDRGAGVERANEVLAALREQVAGGRETIEIVNKLWRRPCACGCNDAWQSMEIGPTGSL